MKGKRTRADAKVREAEKAAKRAAQGNKPKKIAAVKATETGTATAQKPEVSCFISDFDQYLFGQGNHYDIFRKLAITTIGVLSISASAIPVMVFVAPGPEVTNVTPTLPDTRAYP